MPHRSHSRRGVSDERLAVCKCGGICAAYPVCRHPDFLREQKEAARFGDGRGRGKSSSS